MDHLSLDAIGKECAREAADFYTCEQIKLAALALSMNPNALAARLPLMMFAFGNIVEITNPFRLAAISETGRKLAKSMYKYNRDTTPLKAFILSNYLYAKRAVVQRMSIAEGRVIPMAEGLSPLYDACDDDHGDDPFEPTKKDRVVRTFAREHPLAIDMLYREADQIIGDRVRLPLRYRDPETGKLPVVPFLLLRMSAEEIVQTLAYCSACGAPVPLGRINPNDMTRGEKERILARFRAWYESGIVRAPGAKALEWEAFALHVLDGLNKHAICRRLSERGIELDAGKIHYIIYNKLGQYLRLFEHEELATPGEGQITGTGRRRKGS